MARLAQEDGVNPLFELEKGRMTEAEFLRKVGEAVSEALGREVTLHGFTETYFAHLHPNEQLIAHLRAVRERGYRMAILTNNVREWERLWRAKLPVDEIFELVVDSAFVGMRKPEPEIYELTLERLGLGAPECVFIDDIDVNCDTARVLGMTAIHFRSTEQAIAELDAALARG